MSWQLYDYVNNRKENEIEKWTESFLKKQKRLKRRNFKLLNKKLRKSESKIKKRVI